jgi:hypothetical protein
MLIDKPMQGMPYVFTMSRIQPCFKRFMAAVGERGQSGRSPGCPRRKALIRFYGCIEIKATIRNGRAGAACPGGRCGMDAAALRPPPIMDDGRGVAWVNPLPPFEPLIPRV